MKIKPLKILGKIVQVAGVGAVAKFAGVEAAGLVALALGTGAGTKVLGKKVEAKTGRRLHKVATPVAAIAVPAVLAPIVTPGVAETLCDALVGICANPGAAGGIMGAIALLVYKFGSGTEKVAG